MDSFAKTYWAILFNRLPQIGFLEGKNLIVDQYATEGRPERYQEVARSMVQAKPDVIALGFDHQLILQVAKETTTIPIVASFGDPVAAGIVKNMARPERNITGISVDAGIDMQGKHLEILRQAVPSASRVAISRAAQSGKGLGDRQLAKLASSREFQSSAYRWNFPRETRSIAKPLRQWPSNRLTRSWSAGFLPTPNVKS